MLIVEPRYCPIKPGDVYGLLTVVAKAPSVGRRYFWECMCRCGEFKVVRSDQLRAGRVKSCGCIWRSHGMTHTKEYVVWSSMRERCRNPKKKDYAHYGGRGIGVCPRWMSFKNFYADMGAKPFDKASIERKDVNGNYCPENCVWADSVQQANNTRSNVFITFRGRKQTMSMWAVEFGVNYWTVSARRAKGYTGIAVIVGKKKAAIIDAESV